MLESPGLRGMNFTDAQRKNASALRDKRRMTGCSVHAIAEAQSCSVSR